MAEHIGSVEAGLRRAPVHDAPPGLRDALAPVAKGAPHPSPSPREPAERLRAATPVASSRNARRAPNRPR